MGEAASVVELVIRLRSEGKLEEAQSVLDKFKGTAEGIKELGDLFKGANEGSDRAIEKLKELGGEFEKFARLEEDRHAKRRAALGIGNEEPEPGIDRNALTNTGVGTATARGLPNVAEKSVSSDEEIEAALQLEAAIKRVIAQKTILGQATTAEEIQLQKVTASLAEYKAAFATIATTMQNVAQAKAQMTADQVVIDKAKAEAAAMEQATAAYQKKFAQQKIDNAESERKKKVTDELKASQEAGTQEEEKAVSMKTRLRDAARGLNTEFPILGRIITALASPLGATFALFAVAAKLIKDYSDEVKAAGVASQSLENITSTVENLKTIHEQLAVAAAAFATSFDAISTKAASATEVLQGWNKELLLKQRIEGQLNDAKLDEDLAKIETDKKLTPAQKIEQTAKAQAEARTRKKDEDMKTLLAQAQKEDELSRKAGETAQQSRASAEAMQAKIEGQTKAAKDAAAQPGNVEKANADERARNARMLETARGMMEAAKNGAVGTSAFIATNPIDSKELMTHFGNMPLDQIESNILERQKAMDAERQNAERLAAQEEKKRATLQAEQDRQKALALEAEKERDKLSKDATDKYRTYEVENAARPEIDRRRNNATGLRTKDAVEKANESTGEGIKHGLDQFNHERGQMTHDGRAPGFATANAELPKQLDTIQEVTNAMKMVGEHVLKLTSDQSAALKDIAARLALVEKQNKTGRGLD
jgi:hypothetical protein